jgi:hypothetical protein
VKAVSGGEAMPLALTRYRNFGVSDEKLQSRPAAARPT